MSNVTCKYSFNSVAKKLKWKIVVFSALLNISPQELAMSDSLADQKVPNFEMEDVCADIDVLDSSIDEQVTMIEYNNWVNWWFKL